MNTIDKNNNIALEASAGTGKTYQLSMRVTGMLLDAVPPKDILCLTFTRKATAEMLERILKLLEELASGTTDPTDIATLEPLLRAQAAKRGKDYDDNYIRTAAEKARERLLAEFSTLNIKTLDSFFSQILKIFPFEAQLRPDYSVQDEILVADTRLEAYHAVISTLLKNSDWKDILRKAPDIFGVSIKNFINKLGEYATFADDNYIALEKLIKTSDLTPKKILHEIDSAANAKHDAESFLAAFSEKVLQRDELNGQQTKAVLALTEKGEFLKIIKSKMITDGPDNHGYFKKIMFTQSELKQTDSVKKCTKLFLKHKGEAIKLMTLAIGGMLHVKFAELKKAMNVLTYGDITEAAYRMLATETSVVDKDYLYFRLDGKINHILIDEFQDTSPVQWSVLKPLAEEALAGIGQGDKVGSFFYVGDLKQNLYRFRGGSTVLFDKILADYEGKITKATLGVNFRSDSCIVEVVNIISKSAAAFFQIPALSVFNINQTVPDNRAEGYVEICHLAEDETTGEFTVKKVQKAATAGYSYGDMAVLVPTNDKGKEAADALSEAGIPVLRETAQKLSSSPVFKAIFALADFIETNSLSSFSNYALISAFDVTPPDFAVPDIRLAVMQKILSVAKMNEGNTIFEKLIVVIKERNMYDRFGHEPDFTQTLDIIAANAPDEKNIAVFKETIENAAAATGSVSAKMKNAVTVMTVHKSKGLQFPLVIVPSLTFDLATKANKTTFVMTERDGALPNIEFVHSKDLACYLDDTQTEAVENENALVKQDAMNKMYVSFTRAKNALIAAVPKPSETLSNIGQVLPQLIDIPYKKGVLVPPVKDTTKQDVHEEKHIDTSHFTRQEKGVFEKQPPESFLASVMGTALHLAAFLLDEPNDKSAERAVSGALSAYGAYLGEKERAALLRHIEQLIENDEFRQLFDGQIFRERKFAEGGALYSIDVYSVFSDRIILADYKTGELDEQKIEIYSQQLNKYASILSNIYMLPVTKLLFNFSGAGIKTYRY